MEPLFKVNDIFPVYTSEQIGTDFDAIPENIAYILDASGWKLFKRNGVSVALIKVKAIDGLPEFKESINFTVAKLPYALLEQVTEFFAIVYEKNKTEAVGYLYYQSETQEWDFIPPVQTATAASANYGEPPEKPGWMVAGTIHSHGSMGAFHSSTDKNDEKHFDGVHITIGKVDTNTPEYAYCIVAQGGRLKCEQEDLIEVPPIPTVDIPSTWMEAVKLSEPELIKDKEFGEEAEKIYTKYLSGDLTEKAYLNRLKKLEDKSESTLVSDSPKYDSGYFARSGSRGNRWSNW